MNVLNRLARIFRAKTNAALDHMEDPIEAYRQILRDNEPKIRETRKQVADAMGHLSIMKQDLAEAQKESAAYEEQAGIAIDQGNDDLARECLARKNDYDTNATIYEGQIQSQQQQVKQLRQFLFYLEAQFASAHRNLRMREGQRDNARAIADAVDALRAMSGSDASSELTRLDDELRREIAGKLAQGELMSDSFDLQIAKLKTSRGMQVVEAQFQEMKAERAHKKLQPPSPH